MTIFIKRIIAYLAKIIKPNKINSLKIFGLVVNFIKNIVELNIFYTAFADEDETGDNKTKYAYADGTNAVCVRTLHDGGKFFYGYDYDDTVTSISQSTEEGEGNSTKKYIATEKSYVVR